jgi:hypothetical protein
MTSIATSGIPQSPALREASDALRSRLRFQFEVPTPRMSQTQPPEDLMQYEAMAQDALRGVVKAALKKAAAPGGLPEPHHLYITFKTKAAGVSGPQDLLGKYPDEMTIVLQHQYWDLAPGDAFFSVTLKFGGQPKRLSVPYAAVTRFYDPSVQFALQFAAPEVIEDEPEPEAEPEAKAPAPAGDEGPKIVSLDQFRKK